ncbi:MAG: M3 family metallopeptidase [Dysgonamonadaceae bacterium]
MTAFSENPFLRQYSTPHQTPPFYEIKTEHYVPAFEKGIAEHQQEIDCIASCTDAPTFENTIEAFEKSGNLLNRVSSVFFNLLSAESNDEMMVIAQQMSPKLSEHGNNVTLNVRLFERIKVVYQNRNTLNLSAEKVRLIEKIYEDFEDNGATLSDTDKEAYRQLTAELSLLTLEFGQNILKETNAFEMLLDSEEQLAGLPDSVREAAAAKAKEKGKCGWLFDLSAPSYIPFMKYSQEDSLREKLYMAFSTKGAKGDALDNKANIQGIVNARLKIAQLMGYPDYATYALRDKMAKNKENVYSLLDELRVAFCAAAQKDVDEVKRYAGNIEGQEVELKPWNWNYYSEKLKDSLFSVSDETIRPYFELENVKKGVFGLATALYGITFCRNLGIPVYHPEVDAYDVFDENGQFLAVLFTDFHPREGKRQGAWMTEFKGQYKRAGVNSRPHISLVMNFTRPTENTPALLTFDEVETFLHEFGHGLHGMLTDCTYEMLSGTNVARDFVELPSQIMENWLTEKEFLDRFAVHYKTGQQIPGELVKRLVDAANFNAGYLCYRQLSFGYMDMAWHTLNLPFEENVFEFEQKSMEKVQLLPVVPGTSTATAFNHIFSGGYAAGYYSYKWSELLDADAFAAFKQHGIFDKQTAYAFRRNILEKGNTEDPMTLYVRFRGQQPTVDALLERSGVKH